jgi:hypothetical protein
MTNSLETQVTMIPVYSNGAYYIDVGPYKKHEDLNHIINCYRIINKQTGVIEYMEMALAQAIMAADSLEKALSDVLLGKKANQIPVIN